MNAGLKTNPTQYFTLQATVSPANFYQYTAPPGSGGSFNPTTANSFANNLSGLTLSAGQTVTNCLLANRMVRDMGKSVVASGSTFRKIQLLVPNGTNITGGQPAVTGVQGGYTGYLTGYVQVANENNTLATDATIALLSRVY
jgi:hypothetical protein